MAYTELETDGGFWVLDVIPFTPSENKTLSKLLNKLYTDKNVHILYLYDKSLDDVEIIDVFVLSY